MAKDCRLGDLGDLLSDKTNFEDRMKQYRAAVVQLVEVPAAREACLQVLCYAAFDLLQREENKSPASVDGFTEPLMSLFSESCHVMQKFCESDDSVWTPFLFDWSLGLLAELCGLYDGLIRKEQLSLDKRIPSFTEHPVIGKVVQVVKKSMSFIAMFCATLVPALLRLGLTEFMEAKGSMSEEHIPRIIPVLEHLILRHRTHLQSAFMELFQESLHSDPSQLQLYIIPFLVNLSFWCAPITSLFLEEGVGHLKIEVLELVHMQVKQWTFSHSVRVQLISIFSHLQSIHAFTILQFLADVATESVGKDIISKMTQCFLDSLLVRLNELYLKETVPLLSSLRQHVNVMTDWLVNLLSSNKSPWLLDWVRRLLVLTGLHSGREVSASILKHLIKTKTHKSLPPMFAEIQCVLEHQFPRLLQEVLDSVITDLGMSHSLRSHANTSFSNLLSFLLLEKENHGQLARSSCMKALRNHVAALASALLSSPSDVECILQILLLLFGQNFTLALSAELALCHACCNFYFSVLCDKHSPCFGKRQWYLEQCRLLLAVVTRRTTAQFLVVRLVVEGLLELGSELIKLPLVSTTGSLEVTSLLAANQKQGNFLGQRQISRAFSQTSQTARARQSMEITQFSERHIILQSVTQGAIDLLHVCCTDPAQTQHTFARRLSCNGALSIATVLIDVIAPIRIHTEGWPDDEELLKLTLEKDLMVKRYFSKHPVLWELLLLIAPVPGALLKCKSVVASLLASEISFWKHCRKQQTKQALSDLQATIKTVRVIVLAEWLPPQTAIIPFCFEFLTPEETWHLLLSIMRHVRLCDGSSSVKNGSGVTGILDTVRNIVQANISTLGHIFSLVGKT
ncbi:integrator complex subunit 5-like isoform X2 [Corticium candelabrum]|uniref:integrator complex subunit 5-like isoform X2 n=1 Tax=Corticium candelabrum TaxID=121492 RepID=UPI002E273583|nr:integrator complex subunit 5-like isoform X2 [Corticium candelabrum]